MEHWNILIGQLSAFVLRISTLDRSGSKDAKIQIEREIVRYGYHRTPFPEDRIFKENVVNAMSHGFWCELLALRVSTGTLKVCARYFRRFAIMPYDFLRIYIDIIAEGTKCKTMARRLAILARYGIVNFNSSFFDTLGTHGDSGKKSGPSRQCDGVGSSVGSSVGGSVCLPYVIFLATVTLSTTEEPIFEELVRILVVEFGADPTIGMLTECDPILLLPTQEMRDRLEKMRSIYLLHTSDYFLEHDTFDFDLDARTPPRQIESAIVA